MSNGEEINEATLLAYLNKELGQEEMLEVDRWLIQSSANMQKLNDIRETWKMAGRLRAKPVSVNTDDAWQKVLDEIATMEETVIPIRTKINFRLIAVAASLLMLIGVASVFLLNKPSGSGELKLTAANEVVSDILPDGSEVTLNKNSALSYPSEFKGDERRISLKGEAFFEVERNEAKPFIVSLPHSFYVKVLGTSFDIKANDDEDQTVVFVNSGKVEFGSETDMVILTAGEKGIMNNATGEVEKISAKSSSIAELFWMEERLEFKNEPLSEVIAILNEVYDDKVVLNCEQQADQLYRSKHSRQSLEEVVNIIIEYSDGKLKLDKKTDGSGTVFYLNCND